MDILLWIVFGLVVGLVAELIMPGPDPAEILCTIMLGIVGAMLGGWLGRVMGLYPRARRRASSWPWWARSSCSGIYRLAFSGRSRVSGVRS